MVGVMNTEVQRNIAIQREHLLKLMEDKNRLETEIRTQQTILQQNGVGMDEPLVDSQGFPRNDIDVYRVRHARHSTICLRNDLEAIMKKIEDGLHLVHATMNGSATSAGNGSDYMEITSNGGTDSTEPIARVKWVVPDSPAFLSGLLTDDLVLEFGSVNANNFISLEDISRVVQHSINGIINLVVLRGHMKIPLKLCPKQWSGRGLLGCTISPIENVER